MAINTFAFAASSDDRTNIAARESAMNINPALAARQQRQLEARQRFCEQLAQAARESQMRRGALAGQAVQA